MTCDKKNLPPPGAGLELFLFTTNLSMASEAHAAGVSGLVVDWEWRGKDHRQAGADTEVNRDSEQDLRALAALDTMRRCCRLNAFGEWTPGEVELAVGHGATDLLLPMVRQPGEVEAYLRLVDGRARAGILIETGEACACAPELGRLPLDLVYIGLNDLALERRDHRLFLPLVDGTGERLRQACPEVAFGFGGLTVLDGGSPVPCLYLLEEMARLDCNFTFLRRSFKRDIVGRDMAAELDRLNSAWDRLGKRPPHDVEAAHAKLRKTLQQVYGVL